MGQGRVGLRHSRDSMSTFPQRRFIISMLQGKFYRSHLLSVAAVIRVAKNPVKLGHIHVLILKHL